MMLAMSSWMDKRSIGAGLRLAAGAAAPLRLGETLLSRGWLFEPELASALAEQFGLRYVDLVRHPLDPSAARLLPLEVARRMFAVPVRFVDSGAIEVAVGDPADADVDSLEQILGRRVEVVVGERTVIQDAWRYLR